MRRERFTHDVLFRWEVRYTSKQTIAVNFDLKFENITDINPSFAKARVAIAYAGRNRNRSAIPKEVFEEALPSLFYCPVVGRYDPEKDDFGGHDIRVVRGQDGNLQVENATVPFGVVFAGADHVCWETVTEADGTQREYLFCDVILWKRQYGYDRLAAQDTWHQSMEINVERYMIDSDGYCNIEKMYYEALCILGNDVEPCFESASVQLSTETAVSSYRTQFSAMLDELRQIPDFQNLNFDFSGKNQSKGGRYTLNFTNEVRDRILAEFGFAAEELTFEITPEMTEAEFRAALGAMKQTESASFSLTYRQRREAIEQALEPEITRDGSGRVVSETDYYLVDFDDTYAFLERYVWTADDSRCTKGRRKYVIDEGTNTASLEGAFEEMVVQWLTLEENEKLMTSRNAFEQLTADYEAYQASHSYENTEVEELRQFRQERLDGDHKNEIDAVLAEFADLSENEEFTALCADGAAYRFSDAEDLRKECYAIRGKSVKVKFEVKPKAGVVKIPMEQSPAAAGRYGDLFDRYG